VPENSTRPLKQGLLAVTVALLLMLSARPMAGAAVANTAQVGLAKVTATGVRDTQAIRDGFGLALAVCPENMPAGRGLWRSLAAAGQYEEAEAIIERLLARGQKDDIAAMLLGLLRLARADREGAFRAWHSMSAQIGGLALYFDSILKQDNGKLGLPLFSGESVTVDHLLVRDLAEAGIQAGYSDVWLYLIVGDYYRSDPADLELALQWYYAGRRAFPSNFIPSARAAELLSHLARYEESRALYEEAFAKCHWPRDDYLIRMGQSHLREEHPDLAAIEFERAVSISPDKAEWRVLLGDAYVALGDLERAQQQFEHAVRLAPDLDSARIRLERLLER